MQWAEQCVSEQRRQRDSPYCATASFPGALPLQDGPGWIPQWTTSPRLVAACPSLRLCSSCWDTSTSKHLESHSADTSSVKAHHCLWAVTENKAEKSQKVSLPVASESLHQVFVCSMTHGLNHLAASPWSELISGSSSKSGVFLPLLLILLHAESASPGCRQPHTFQVQSAPPAKAVSTQKCPAVSEASSNRQPAIESAHLLRICINLS